MPFLVEQPIGRLLLIRIAPPATPDDARNLLAELMRYLPKVQGGAIIANDVRGTDLIAAPVADAFIDMMRRDNKYVLRAALLVTENAGFAMQVYRLVKDAGGGNRRVFTDLIELETWLAEIMTAAELQALRKHFGIEKSSVKLPQRAKNI